MPRNVYLLIAASYFWFDALNTFLFSHRPMTPTFADVLLLTGLDVSSTNILFTHWIANLLTDKNQNVGGWSVSMFSTAGH